MAELILKSVVTQSVCNIRWFYILIEAGNIEIGTCLFVCIHERDYKLFNLYFCFCFTEQVDVAIAMQPTFPNILFLLLWVPFSFEKIA
jgi:hypothetical protein